MTLHDDFRAAVLALNPEAYWDFHGLAPGALLDVTGHGHDLTGHGVFTVGNAVIGWDGFNYASFNGTSAYFTMAGGTPIPNGPFSIFAVAQPTNGDVQIISSEPTPTINAGAGLGVANAGSSFGYLARVTGAGGTTTVVDNLPFSVYGSGWQWIGNVWDGTSCVLYINGTPVKATLRADFTRGANVPTIGCYPALSNFLRGGISDLYVLSGAQSLLSIRQMAALTGNPAAPIAQDINAQLAAIYAAVHKEW